MTFLLYYRQFSLILLIFGFCTFSLNRSGTKASPCKWNKCWSWCYLIIMTVISLYIAFENHTNRLKTVRDISSFLQTISNVFVYSVSLLLTISMGNNQIQLLNRLYAFDQNILKHFNVKMNDRQFFMKLYIRTVSSITLITVIKFCFAIASGRIKNPTYTYFFTWLQITLLLVALNVSSIGEILTYRFQTMLKMMMSKSNGKWTYQVTSDQCRLAIWYAALSELCDLKQFFSDYYGPELLLNIVLDAIVITFQIFSVIRSINHGMLRWSYVMFLLARVIPICSKNLILTLNLNKLAKQVKFKENLFCNNYFFFYYYRYMRLRSLLVVFRSMDIHSSVHR